MHRRFTWRSREFFHSGFFDFVNTYESLLCDISALLNKLWHHPQNGEGPVLPWFSFLSAFTLQTAVADLSQTQELYWSGLWCRSGCSRHSVQTFDCVSFIAISSAVRGCAVGSALGRTMLWVLPTDSHSLGLNFQHFWMKSAALKVKAWMLGS